MKTEIVPVAGGHLSAHSIGKGKPLLFLHGGPGDTHHYMKRMAEPLFENHQCIFFDQRGSGDSKLHKVSVENFNAKLVLSDAVAVARHFGVGPCTLVGHSWGAMYGLFLSIQFPTEFTRAALVSMGPLNPEMGKEYEENLSRSFSISEHLEWEALRKLRSTALETNDFIEIKRIDTELMKIRVKSWVYNPDLRADFLLEYHQDPPPNRQVNKWIWESFKDWFSWEQLNRLSSKIWLCSGANDPTPIAQSQKILSCLPKESRFCLLENCGHIPWLEHPDLFYSQLKKFLDSD